MTREHHVGDEVVLRLSAIIESTVTDGQPRACQVRLETGDLLGLTPEQLAAAVDAERARGLLLNHLLAGELLGSHEVAVIEAAGLSPHSDFDGIGGDLFRHVLLQDDEDE